MPTLLVCLLCLLGPFVNRVEGSYVMPRCKVCKMITQYNTYLNLRYCPHCIRKHRGFWHYFISFTKAKIKHIATSYSSQYTPLNIINNNICKVSLNNYEKKLFIEFMDAVWHKLNDIDYVFKNPDLENFFLALFDEEEILKAEKRYGELLQFYYTLKWVCLALFCEYTQAQNYVRHLHTLFEKIDDKILSCSYSS